MKSRLLIQREEAGTPIAAPMRNFVAARIRMRQADISKEISKLTDVAPDRRGIVDAVVPYDRVDEVDETGERRPEHVGAGGGIPGL